jgi:hypothetical protein
MKLQDKYQYDSTIVGLNGIFHSVGIDSFYINSECVLCGRASDQKSLGANLDEMCVHILDKNLHGDAGVSTEIFGGKYFLN